MFDIINDHMPVYMQMAFSGNTRAFGYFLGLKDEEQDKIINKAKEIKELTEMEAYINSIEKVF
ncbi:MAG: hypothetical protein IJX51_08235 [Clostridia bacterium]|nr:hypothetical protein [Clostridia bacterium]